VRGPGVTVLVPRTFTPRLVFYHGFAIYYLQREISDTHAIVAVHYKEFPLNGEAMIENEPGETVTEIHRPIELTV
jgi:hypothetical protein